MYVPIPYLAAAGLILLLLGWLLLRPRGDRDLMAPPSARSVPPTRPAPPVPAEPLEAELRGMLAGGNKLLAIKRAREALHLGLAEAKDLVEAIERGAPLEPLPSARSRPAGLDDELRRLVAQDRKIEAIKRAREALGLGLKEALDYVESL